MSEVTIHVKGICEPINPGGRMCFAWVAYEGERKIAEDAECGPRRLENTNNLAEYWAIIMALTWAASRGYRDVLIKSNNEVVVRQILGEYECSSEMLLALHRTVGDLATRFTAITLEQVGKFFTKDVVELAKSAYESSVKGVA